MCRTSDRGLSQTGRYAKENSEGKFCSISYCATVNIINSKAVQRLRKRERNDEGEIMNDERIESLFVHYSSFIFLFYHPVANRFRAAFAPHRW